MPPQWHAKLGFGTIVAYCATFVTGLFSLFDKPDPADNEAFVAYIGSALVVFTGMWRGAGGGGRV